MLTSLQSRLGIKCANQANLILRQKRDRILSCFKKLKLHEEITEKHRLLQVSKGSQHSTPIDQLM